ITVCTHFMPAGIMAHLIKEGDVDTHLSIVVTDFDCHAMWLSRVFHRYFVALDETKAHLEALGLPGERITVSGIPTDAAFARTVDRDVLCREHGLVRDKPILLMSAGTFGVGPAEYVVSRLRQLQHEAQIIVTCGRGAELQEKITTIVNGDPRFRILGYTDRMHDLMQLSDLFIGKPGGLTTAEALVCGLPMAIFSPIPGQEERNSDHLLEEGIAIRCNNLTTIAYKVDKLLSDPARLASMRANTRKLARPQAAQDIVNTLLDDHLPPLQLNAEAREAMTDAALKP
ncbi:MAG: glycosyltransferase, partial [Prosthecobacter sp.]|nr:glycosyltransferase [Prosthecobacter sp.]